jgi:hypothetical protein
LKYLGELSFIKEKNHIFYNLNSHLSKVSIFSWSFHVDFELSIFFLFVDKAMPQDGFLWLG